MSISYIREMVYLLLLHEKRDTNGPDWGITPSMIVDPTEIINVLKEITVGIRYP